MRALSGCEAIADRLRSMAMGLRVIADADRLHRM